jgi:hypothetical protein
MYVHMYIHIWGIKGIQNQPYGTTIVISLVAVIIYIHMFFVDFEYMTASSGIV